MINPLGVRNSKGSAVLERKALIFNVQKYNMYDGPGLRTIVFFKGCPLRCKWCSNPEGQLRRYQVLYKKDACVRCGNCARVCPVGVFKLQRDYIVDHDVECIGCGRCEAECPKEALALQGEYKTISELLDLVLEDKPFYDTSGGGLTIGGGEVLMQPEAAVNLLTVCKQNGVNTAIETSGYARPETVAKVAEVTDLFLYDIKHMDSDKHYELTGVRNESILTNLKWLLDNRHNVRIRMPLLKGMNDGEKEIRQLIEFLKPYREHKNFKGVDLLPYHKLGVHKYTQLGLEYPIKGDPALSKADLERLEGYFKQSNIPVAVIQH